MRQKPRADTQSVEAARERYLARQRKEDMHRLLVGAAILLAVACIFLAGGPIAGQVIHG